tara:strand:- start:25964 stop:26671 length:708 start_codon:yes stop_codon:yes gene_type:complete
MPKKRSKRYVKAAEMVDFKKQYALSDAVEVIKKFPAPKFDQSITISFKLGVDPRKSDQMVRGTCALPHGSGKEVKVVVFAEGEAAIAAKNAGAEHVGYEDLLKKVKDGFTDFDVAIATPAAMAEVRKLGRVLGPRGLMPNPKTGTVTDDTATAIQEVKAGRVDFKIDRNSNVSVPVGKVSFEPQQLVENTKAVIDAISTAKPASAKGVFVQAMTLAATMSPGISVDSAGLIKATV